MEMWSKLEVLRNIDSIIDFSRATAQLRILIALDNEPLTIDDIVAKTNLRRKTILDAIRKLELKGIVSRRNGKYVLTDVGKSIYEALRSIVSSSSAETPTLNVNQLRIKPTIYDLYTDLLSAVYMLRALKILGRKKDHKLSLHKLALKLGVSPVTLENHIRRFTAGKLSIFRRVEGTGSQGSIYELTDLGLKLYQKLYPKRGLLDRIRLGLMRFLTF